MFIDATVIKGLTKVFNCTIETLDDTGQSFSPFNLTPYSIRFRVLGSTTADAKVLVEHIINSNTDPEKDGEFVDATNGNFTFVVTAEDTKILGLGDHPIQLDLLDYETGECVATITQGGQRGEFSKIMVIQV